MKLKKYQKKIIITSLALTLSFSTFAPTIEVFAASKTTGSSVVYATIRANGVRLRKEGNQNGTILELMNKGEGITFYPSIFGTDPEYNYMRRLKTKTCGYVDHNYVNY